MKLLECFPEPRMRPYLDAAKGITGERWNFTHGTLEWRVLHLSNFPILKSYFAMLLTLN